ncbi:GntR family transcriptional regulator [Acuticoccus kandeliae]|uniref:GntR family transcriptional regulator n=1 Tax=Acuticoccus kandeliae TaxID=2073160 RepID=UPI0014743E5B|nr:GntR family transcriptional regulator [Acuticoccus kandeliae]
MSVTSRPRVDDIVDAIRKRIFLQPVDAETVFLEGALANEFGVSRTPVRQALQRLAYEGLIEVRTGVGSLSNPLDPKERDLHVVVHCGVLRLVASLPDAPVVPGVSGRLAALAEVSRFGHASGADEVFDLFTEFNATLSRMVPDTVVADAHLVSGWRVVRWVLSEMRQDHDGRTAFAHELCLRVHGAAGEGRAAVFGAAADVFTTGLLGR